MGLCGFVTMLFSMLGLVSFGRSFPHRKPVNKLMLALTFALFGAVILADVRYIGAGPTSWRSGSGWASPRCCLCTGR